MCKKPYRFGVWKMEHPQLSILICHLKNRGEIFKILHEKLTKQITTPGSVEIIVAEDNGDISIGAKRNKLLSWAIGDYVAFVDDDDDVSDDYVSSILSAVVTSPDCVGIEGILKSNFGDMLFRHSIQFQGWYTGVDAFYRTPNHLNPVKRGIAQSIIFPDIQFGEDQRYSDYLQKMLKTEIYIGHPIYFYRKDYPTK